MTGPARRGAVFFDRDGVLNVDTGYVHRWDQFVWRPGAPEAVAAVKAAGLLAIVATNQSGVARGLYAEEDVERLHAAMNDDLARRVGARIDAFYHCPYHPDAVAPRYRHPDHPDRKPNPGMLLRAIADFGLDPAAGLMIGDRESDVEAARRAGVRAILVGEGDLAAQLRTAVAPRRTADPEETRASRDEGEKPEACANPHVPVFLAIRRDRDATGAGMKEMIIASFEETSPVAGPAAASPCGPKRL